MKKKNVSTRRRTNKGNKSESPNKLLTGELRETPIASLMNQLKTSKEKLAELANNILNVLKPSIKVNVSASSSPVERIASNPIVTEFSRHNLTWKKMSLKEYLGDTDRESAKGKELTRKFRKLERDLVSASKALRKMSASERASLRYSIARDGSVRTSVSYQVDDKSASFVKEQNQDWLCQLSKCSFYELAVLALNGSLHSRDLSYIRTAHPHHFDAKLHNDGNRWDRESMIGRIASVAKGIQDSPNFTSIAIETFSAEEDKRNADRAAKLAANAAKAREAKAKSKSKGKASTATKKRSQAEKDASLLREAATASQVRRTLAKAAAIESGEKKLKRKTKAA